MQYLIKPWQHQMRAIEMSRVHPNLALFFEMGTGKTSTIINIVREHFARAKRVVPTLIITPIITVKNWQREFSVHSKIDRSNVVALVGPGKKRLETFLKHAYTTDKAGIKIPVGKIFITNYEAMEMDELVDAFYEWKPLILACDESQRLKNPTSKRAKKVIMLADGATHRYILTGTPILNSAMDVFNQFRILDAGETFGQNFFSFRAQYFFDMNAGMPKHMHFPKWTPRPETFFELNKKIYTKALMVRKQDCLDLPPLVKEKIEVDMGPEQRRMYGEMQDDFIAWVHAKEKAGEPKAVVAQLAITKALRLMQMTSGFAKTDDGVHYEIKDNPKIEALEELLEELCQEHKVIVWAAFRENYRHIAELCAKLKLDYVELHGGISQKMKDDNMDKFRSKPQYRVCIANAAAAGIGVNLVEASYSVFFSRDFSLEHDLQAESRNYRGGSEIHAKVTRIDIVTTGTVDEKALDAIANKQDMADVILGIARGE